jgi:hypothetical protein
LQPSNKKDVDAREDKPGHDELYIPYAAACATADPRSLLL